MMSDMSKLPITSKEQLPATKISFPNRNFLGDKAAEVMLRAELHCNGFALVPAAPGYAIEKSREATPAADMNACIVATSPARSGLIGVVQWVPSAQEEREAGRRSGFEKNAQSLRVDSSPKAPRSNQT
jgi:hypothetical protein